MRKSGLQFGNVMSDVEAILGELVRARNIKHHTTRGYFKGAGDLDKISERGLELLKEACVVAFHRLPQMIK